MANRGRKIRFNSKGHLTCNTTSKYITKNDCMKCEHLFGISDNYVLCKKGMGAGLKKSLPKNKKLFKDE